MDLPASAPGDARALPLSRQTLAELRGGRGSHPKAIQRQHHVPKKSRVPRGLGTPGSQQQAQPSERLGGGHLCPSIHLGQESVFFFPSSRLRFACLTSRIRQAGNTELRLRFSRYCPGSCDPSLRKSCYPNNPRDSCIRIARPRKPARGDPKSDGGWATLQPSSRSCPAHHFPVGQPGTIASAPRQTPALASVGTSLGAWLTRLCSQASRASVAKPEHYEEKETTAEEKEPQRFLAEMHINEKRESSCRVQR